MRGREDRLTLVTEFFEVARPSRSGVRSAAARCVVACTRSVWLLMGERADMKGRRSVDQIGGFVRHKVTA